MKLKKGIFCEYGRVKYYGKWVSLGVVNIDGVEMNKAYYIKEDGKLQPLSKSIEDKNLRAIFKLDIPSINYEKSKEIDEKLKEKTFEKLGDINIKEYMPSKENVDATDEEYDIVLEMLERIQKRFEYVSGENLKFRLPNLTIEHVDNGADFVNAYFRPRSNYLGICEKALEADEGKCIAIHELNHMVSSAVEKDEDGNVRYVERTGFGDEYFNGIAVTEGFNEMFASMSRKGDPISYSQEVGWATEILSFTKDRRKLVNDFYEGNFYRTRELSKDERKAKVIIKNMDYNFAMYFYNMSNICNVIDLTTTDVLEQYRKMKINELGLKGQEAKELELAEDEIKSVEKAVREQILETYKFPFTEANFMSNVELGLLDLYEEKMKEDISDLDKSLMTYAVLGGTIFTFNESDELEKMIDQESLSLVDNRFINICKDRGMSVEEITNLLMQACDMEEDSEDSGLIDNGAYSKIEASKKAKETENIENENDDDIEL